MKNKQLVLAVIVLLTAVFICACSGKKKSAASWEFTSIRRGNLERVVTSSGTINPVATVKVLPRMSGKVEKVNVDYNDTVRRGDILAELNTDMLRLQRDQQNASVQKARANYELQLINFRSQEILAERGLISEYELKSSKTALDNQAADLAVAEANLRVIQNEIYQYAYITSPIDGIVLDRNINVGDTVVDSSNNNSSSIFTIAENMREMQIEANVGELDITSIYRGQEVRFTLESLQGRRFSGVVENLRMVPVVSNNVVNYTVIINAENRDGSLLPGMTCMVDFVVQSANNILMVSNAALRYQPTGLTEEQISDMVFQAGLDGMSDDQKKSAIEARDAAAQSAAQRQTQNANTGITSLMMGQQGGPRMMGGAGGGRQSQGGAAGQTRAASQVVTRNLWFINEDGKLGVIRVNTGVSDGSSTELFLEKEFEGRQVILREKI